MKIWNRIVNILEKIELVDKCLLIIMIILMAQSAFTLFVPEIISQEDNAIDVIARTSAAAIFGYFLSGNFIKHGVITGAQSQNNSSIILPKSLSDVETENFKTTAPTQCNKYQVIIVATVGITSLCILLLLRNFMEVTPQAIATISQLRDFVSACVGFLVSCGKVHSTQS